MREKLGKWELIGRCGVDSGQLMIVDPCYLDDFVNNNSTDEIVNGNFCYSGACAETVGVEHSGGQLRNKIGAEVGVVFASGYGDGCYSVYAKKNKEGRVMQVKIEM